MGKVSALQYVLSPERYPPGGVCALVGEQLFLQSLARSALRTQLIQDAEAQFAWTSVPGPEAQWPDVLAELSTLPLFGSDKRIVCVQQADTFISRFRSQLEQYVAEPQATAVLVLEAESLPGNTRLAKAIVAGGLLIDCSEPKRAELQKWLPHWAQHKHQVHLSPAAAQALVELVGDQVGLLDQEIAKLASLAGSAGHITTELVQQSAGDWRVRSAWEMLDAALEGRPADALRLLDRLLTSGENPVGLLAQLAFSLRRLAGAAQLVRRHQAVGRRVPLQAALAEVGVPKFFLQKAERQLRHLGYARALRLYDLLLEADMGLKGSSRLPPRIVLERLLLQLAAPQDLAAFRST